MGPHKYLWPMVLLMGVNVVACGGGSEDLTKPAMSSAPDVEQRPDGDWEWPSSPGGEERIELSIRPESGEIRLPGDHVNICLYLDVNTGNVSGLQADVLWDPQCLALAAIVDDRASCAVEPDTGRSTFDTRVLGPGRLRMLMVNLFDTSPIESEVTRLACCAFRAVGRGKTSCEVYLDAVVASDPRGQRLPVKVRHGSVELGG